MPMTEEELELLTPEERAGLELDDDNVEDADEGDDNQGDDDNQQEDDQDADEDDGEEDGDDQDQDEGDESDPDDDQDDDAAADDGQPGRDDGADTDDQGADGEDEANPDRPIVPEFTLTEPEGVEDKLKALDEREDKLTEQFDDGDITTAEYRKGLRELGKERDDITWSVRKYEQAKERHEEAVTGAQQQFMQNWFKTADDFVKSHPEISRNKTVMQVFDNIVQGVNTEENINKFSHQRRLEMAYKQWAEDLGIQVQEPTGKGKQAKPAKKAAPPKKRDLPPTLGKVPSAEVNETDDGSFGTLNRLFNSSNPKDVAKAEDMLSRMPEAEQDRYLRSN
jgi:hypothetical protein